MYNSVASRRSFQLVEPIVVFVHANNFLVERLPATGIETASPLVLECQSEARVSREVLMEAPYPLDHAGFRHRRERF